MLGVPDIRLVTVLGAPDIRLVTVLGVPDIRLVTVLGLIITKGFHIRLSLTDIRVKWPDFPDRPYRFRSHQPHNELLCSHSHYISS